MAEIGATSSRPVPARAVLGRAGLARLGAAAVMIGCATALAACGSGADVGTIGGHVPTTAASGRSATTISARRAVPIWPRSLQMVSPADGWALAWLGSPDGTAPVAVALVRTSDGGRTWTEVTPGAAKPLLDSENSYPVLLASTAGRAWLAVTLMRSQSGYGVTPHRTEVFGTTDAGRSWTASNLIRAPGSAGWLDFTDPANGWLLQNLGAAMQQNHLQLYRTSDRGRHWSLIAQTLPWPHTGTSRSGLPVDCDKTGIAFATPRTGWITGDCFTLADAFLLTHDGGLRWTPQPLPVPSDACQSAGCDVSPPEFFGATGFLTVGSYPGPGYLLVSHDTGATWTTVPLPPGSDPYARVRFFDAAHGLVVPAGPQGTVGRVFYVTTDAGRTWRPVPQGGPAWQPGTTVEFVTLDSGFAWNPNARRPVIYATVNGGRTWHGFTPLG